VSTAYSTNINKSFELGKKLAIALGGFMGFVGLLSAAALALILWYGGKLVHDGKITTGVLAAFLMYTLQVAMAFAFLTSIYGDFMQALGASQRIFEILDSVPEINLKSGLRARNEAQEEETFDGSLVIENLSFSYPTRAESKVLKDISLVVERGKTLALVGPSGGGKSTIFSLIERYYDPDCGQICLGPRNINLKEFDLSWVHSRIALVSQEPVLFGGSIKENISFGLDEECDMERVIASAKLANAHDFIVSFEKGYDTLVGERGIRLSGGQKQSLRAFFSVFFNFKVLIYSFLFIYSKGIAIARALLVNPKVFL
jgi:ABC-type multidrug transport system fused ATPase/permease subunit